MATGSCRIANPELQRVLSRFTRIWLGWFGRIHVQWWLVPGPNSLNSPAWLSIPSKVCRACFLLEFPIQTQCYCPFPCCAGRTVSTFPSFELDGTRDAKSVVFSPDGSTLYIATDNWAVCATNSTGESEPEWCEPAQDSNLCDIIISPDGLSVTTVRFYRRALHLVLPAGMKYFVYFPRRRSVDVFIFLPLV